MAESLKKIPAGKRLLISGLNDAVGALQAVRAADRENEVAVVGQSAAREGQMEIRRRNSWMIASVAYFPERYGVNLVRLATDVLRRLPLATYTERMVFVRQNIDRAHPFQRTPSGRHNLRKCESVRFLASTAKWGLSWHLQSAGRHTILVRRLPESMRLFDGGLFPPTTSRF